MSSTAEHWNNIFSNKQDQELGWYEEDVSQTLKYLKDIELDNKTVFLPGAGTSNLVDALSAQNANLILNDISQQALDKLKERVGEENNTYLCANISQPFTESHHVDIWIDRAVLHFLLQEQEILQYFNNLKDSVQVGGHVLFAEFSKVGAPKCAGLELHRYSVDELIERLGTDFELVVSEDHIFINPANLERPYIYAFFKRVK